MSYSFISSPEFSCVRSCSAARFCSCEFECSSCCCGDSGNSLSLVWPWPAFTCWWCWPGLSRGSSWQWKGKYLKQQHSLDHTETAHRNRLGKNNDNFLIKASKSTMCVLFPLLKTCCYSSPLQCTTYGILYSVVCLCPWRKRVGSYLNGQEGSILYSKIACGL